MKEYDENISQNNRKRVSQNIVDNKLNKKRESLMVQKGREFFKNKKAISMRHILKDDKKINININNNININTNINGINQNNDSPDYNTIRPKTLENDTAKSEYGKSLFEQINPKKRNPQIYQFSTGIKREYCK